MPDSSLITHKQAIHLEQQLKHKPKGPFWKIILKELGYLIVIFFISFVVLNWPAISQNIKYTWNVNFNNRNMPTNTVATPIIPTITPAAPDGPFIKIPSVLNIPQIGVKAPIIWDIQGDRIRPLLTNGVVHYAGTAHPGENGNVFIVGHSSDYVWVKSKYKNIFALLNKLRIGDEINLTYNNTQYTYKVTGSKVVKPTDTSVLDPTPTPTLTLMTCWPVGTTNRRLIVTAKQISPEPPTSSPQISTPSINSLPVVR